MRFSNIFSGMNLSISARLTLWYGVTLLVLLSLFAGFSYTTFHWAIHRDFDRHLMHEKRELLPHLQTNKKDLQFNTLKEVRSVAYRTDGRYGTYVRLLAPEGDILYQSPNFAEHRRMPVHLPPTGEERVISRDWEDKPARTHYTPIRGPRGSLKGWLEITGFEWSLHQNLARLGWVLALGTVLTMVLAVGGGFLLSRRALEPVATLTEAAEDIGRTDLSRRLPTHFGVRDELTALAETFNNMITRMEQSLDRERRFTANAAHELLTPLSTIRSEVEISLRRKRDISGYQETLRAVLTDIEDLSEMVKSLLQLSRVERLEDSEHGPVDLSSIVHTHVQRMREQARSHDIDLEFFSDDPDDPICIAADSAHVGEIIKNLLDNAVKYTPSGGRIEVSIWTESGQACLRVSDTGIGLDEQAARHVFDRFFRASDAEVQQRPGSGLGLAIVKAIVQAYDGRIEAQSGGPGKGSTFIVQFSLLPASCTGAIETKPNSQPVISST